MSKLKANELEVVLDNVLSNYDGEAATLIAGLYEILDNDIVGALNVLNNEQYFNYYTDVEDYIDLARALAYDDVLWEDEEEYKVWYKEVNVEEEAKNELNKGGWRIASNGLAIGLCDSILIGDSLIKIA